jgi:hypothetical protein
MPEKILGNVSQPWYIGSTTKGHLMNSTLPEENFDYSLVFGEPLLGEDNEPIWEDEELPYNDPAEIDFEAWEAESLAHSVPATDAVGWGQTGIAW